MRAAAALAAAILVAATVIPAPANNAPAAVFVAAANEPPDHLAVKADFRAVMVSRHRERVEAIAEQARQAELERIAAEAARRAEQARIAEATRQAAALAAARAAAARTPAPVPRPATGSISATIYAAAAEFGVSGDWLHRVAVCESTLNPLAYNPSGASGLFQFMPRTFTANAAKIGYGPGMLWDVTAQSRTAAYMFSIGQSGQWVCR